MEPPRDLDEQLLKQIQFYFSPANLLTDSMLTKQLRANRNRLPVSYLLKCYKVRSLLSQMGLRRHQRRLKIQRLLNNFSTQLKVSHHKVKKIKRFKSKQQSQKFIYIQFQDPSPQTEIQNWLKSIQIQRDTNLSISIKRGKNWMIIVPYTKIQFERILQQLGNIRQRLKITSMYGWKEWKQFRDRYKGVIRMVRIELKNRQNQAHERIKQKQQMREQ